MTVNALADALTELLDNEDFAGRVEADADAALAGYDLDAEERAAIVADAGALSGTSGFNVRQFQSLQVVRVNMGNLQPKNGALLGGAVSRAAEGCGEHGCCSWETALK